MAEILTGTWFAPLGWKQGLIAIVVGHFIGGSMFFCAGYIGARTQKSAMQTVQISFGEKGSGLFFFTQCHATDGMDSCHDLYGR